MCEWISQEHQQIGFCFLKWKYCLRNKTEMTLDRSEGVIYQKALAFSSWEGMQFDFRKSKLINVFQVVICHPWEMERDPPENKPGNACRNPYMNYEIKQMDKSGKHEDNRKGLVDQKDVVHIERKDFWENMNDGLFSFSICGASFQGYHTKT